MKKKFSRVIAHYLPQCLLLISLLTSNVLFPITVIAQEIENTNNVIQEETVPIDTSEDILEEGISTSIYEEEEAVEQPFVFENGIYTVNKVIQDEEYVYPENENVRVKFTEVTQEGNLVIKRVELTEEQKELLNTKDSYGWDITSSMSNGTFKYNLTLPNTQGNEDIEVKYTEDNNTYESIDNSNIEIKSNVVTIEGLDHFTIFVVVDDGDNGYTDTGWTSNGSGYNLDHRYASNNQSGQNATWAYTGDPIANGAIFISWTQWADHATHAKYTFTGLSNDSNTAPSTIYVNQVLNSGQSATDGSGVWSGWYRVPGIYSIAKNATVTLASNLEGGNLSADAVAFVDLSEVPNEVWVDDNYSYNNSGEHFWGYDAFNNIQGGVSAVANNGTVHVASGTYSETINIGKPLSLRGVEGGNKPTILGGVTINTSGKVTIENINFKVPTGTPVDSIHINNINGELQLDVRNCSFDGSGLFLNGKRGIQSDDSQSKITVESSTFSNGYYIAIQGYYNELEVLDSTISNCKSGINFQGGNNLKVTNTNISVIAQGVSNDTYAVRFASDGTNSSGKDMILNGGEYVVDKNGFTADSNTYHSAIIARSGASGTLTANNLSLVGDVVNLSGVKLDATKNWWGDLNPSDNIKNRGTGSIDYSPWWGGNYVGSNHSSAWTWYTNDSIQEAINTNTVNNGDTINVLAGEYHENVIVNKSIILLGAMANVDPTIESSRTDESKESIINPNGSGDGLIVNGTGVKATINGFTIKNTGDNKNGLIAGAFDTTNYGQVPTSASFIYNIVKGGKYKNGIAIENGATGEIKYNKVDGAKISDGVWSGSGILVAGSNNVKVSNNLVENSELGIAVVGYEIWQNAPANKNIIENNTLKNNSTGISVEALSIDTLVSGNSIFTTDEDVNTTGIDVYSYDLSWEQSTPVGTVIKNNTFLGQKDDLSTSVHGEYTNTIVGPYVDAKIGNIWNVNDQTDIDEIESRISHSCSTSPYIHGTCNVNDKSERNGFVEYKDIEAPVNLGWNISSLSSTPNETPLDLPCSTEEAIVYTKENSVAHNWTKVDGVNVKYQREVTYPTGNISYFEVGSNNFTSFSTFGSGAGIEGLWKTRVRAYVDVNMNDILDSTEIYSDWSKYCSITYDKTKPSGEILGIRYPNGTVQDRFITNLNTPLLVGSSDDNNGIVNEKVKIGSYISTYGDAGPGFWNAGFANPIPDGTYPIVLTLTDLAGNETVVTKDITIDTVPPRAIYKHYKDGNEIDEIANPITYVKNINQLSFTAEYSDEIPSSGLYQDSYAIFEAQDDGSFNFMRNGKEVFCDWRKEPNLVTGLSGDKYSLTEKEEFTNCIETLPDGEYYMAHQVYDSATREDIPSIYQYRDVLGLHFIVDSVAPKSEISIVGKLAEGGVIANNNGWHGKGWYYNFDKIVLSVDNPKPGDFIQYQIISGEVFEPEATWTKADNGINLAQTINQKADGIYTIFWYAEDLAGNKETLRREVVKIDRINPTYTIKFDSINGLTNDNVIYIPKNKIDVNVEVEDSLSGYTRARYDLYTANENWNCTYESTNEDNLVPAEKSTNRTLTVSDLPDGKYCLRIWVYDDVQNKATVDTNGKQWVHFVIDNTYPEGEIKGIRYDSKDIENYFITNDNTPKLFGTCSDTNIDTVKLTIDGIGEQTLICQDNKWEAKEPTSPLSDGKHTATLTITDKAGKQATDSQEIIIDTIAPTALYTYYKNGIKITDSKTYVSSIEELTYTGIFKDENSSGLYKDVLVVFRKSDGKAYCGWSQSLSPTGGVSLSGNLQELTTPQKVSQCVTSLSEGEYYISHRVYDNAIRRDAPAYHQHRQYTTLEFVIDSTAPTVEITSPSENSILRGTVEIKGSVQDTNPHHYYYKIEDKDGSIITDETVYTTENITDKVIYTWDTTKVDDGTYKIQLEAKDAADNKDASSIKSITVIVDNKAPTTTLTSDPSGTYINTPVSISGKSIDTNGVDSVNIFYRVTGPTDWTLITTLDNSSKDSPYDWSYTWTPSSDGTYDIKISATDTVGNIEQSAYIYSLTYDSTAPTITVFGIASDILNISATDLLSGTDKIEIKIDNGEWITYTTDMNLNTLLGNAPGTYTIYARVTDKAGNTTQGSTTYTIPTPAVLGATTGPTTTTTKPSVKGTTTTKTTPNISEDTQTEEILETTSIEEPSVLGERCENKKKVSGYVYIDENKDKEMNDNEKGIKDITLTIQYTDEEGNIKTEEEVNTDEKGYWETQLCSGKYNIVVKEDTLPQNIEVAEVLSLTVSDNEKETIFNIQALDTRNFWQKYWYLIVGGLAIIVIGYISIKNRKKEEI